MLVFIKERNYAKKFVRIMIKVSSRINKGAKK